MIGVYPAALGNTDLAKCFRWAKRAHRQPGKVGLFALAPSTTVAMPFSKFGAACGSGEVDL